MLKPQRHEEAPENAQPRGSELNDLLYGDFKPDEHYEKLCDRLAEYYKATPDSMGNKEAMKHWKSFKRWTLDHGYTYKEINRAKRDCRFKGI